jgi:hypothetical protein
VAYRHLGVTLSRCDDVSMKPQTLRVLASDSKPAGDYQALSYTVFADSSMEVTQSDGVRVHFAWEDWVDVQWLTRLADDDDETAT